MRLAAAQDRWRPERAGLLNVWRFQEETFEFHRGRLLLRGPNGSGKSMALELLLPFLLDANASPVRLSSAAKSRGGLYDRVLGGEAHSRVGFLWAEFLRNGDAFTVGVRLRASRATARVTSDWFTTSLRVGRDLQLLDETRTPLSKQAIVEAIGDTGVVHDSADDYRMAVRARLFPGFNDRQYDAVITALLALRREKVSQDLTPSRLSEILTASLAAVDERDIAEIAEGFEKLDRRRDNIEGLERDLKQVRQLSARQLTYARGAILHQAKQVRAAQTRRDDVTKRERQARAELEETTQALGSVSEEDIQSEKRFIGIEAEIETLKNLDLYKQGGLIGPMHEELRRFEVQIQSDQNNLSRRERIHDSARSGLEESERAADMSARAEETARARLDEAAHPLGAGDVVERARHQPDEGRAQALLDGWTGAKHIQIGEVRDSIRLLDATLTERRLQEGRVEEERAALDRSVEEHDESLRTLDESVQEYELALRGWASACSVLGQAVLAERLPQRARDPAAVREVVERRASEVRSDAAVRRSEIERRVQELRDLQQVLEDERALLRDGREIEPDAPVWRTPREASAALPLWRLVDFREDCPEETRDGVEGAMLAAGLLDALVSPEGKVVLPEGKVVLPEGKVVLPEGKVVLPEGADSMLDPSLAPVNGPSLADVLRPDGPLPHEATMRILRSIALDEHPVRISRDGTFRLSLLVGRGPSQKARFIGGAARQHARTERIAAIDAELEVINGQSNELGLRLVTEEHRLTALEAEVAALPDGSEVLYGNIRLQTANALVADARVRLAASQKALAEVERRVGDAVRRLTMIAAQHALPSVEADLQTYVQSLELFIGAASAWTRSRHDHVRALDELKRAIARAEEAAADLDEAKRSLDAAQQQHHAISARVETLERSVGAEFRQVATRLDELEQTRASLSARRRELATERSQLDRKSGNLETAVESAAAARVEAEAERERTHGLFVTAVADGVAADAGVALEISEPDRLGAVLEAARSIAQQFGDQPADQTALSRAQAVVAESVHASRQTLGGRVDISHELSEHGWWLLRTFAGGVRRSVGEYAVTLSNELAAALTELKEEEQRLFDETLTGSVREAVAERIRRSNELVQRINDELSAVRTAAAGVQVRLRWEVDPEQPDAVRSARRLLLRDPADLSETDREALYEFFRARIEQVRTELEAATGWDERLRAVLDYRKWHRFGLEIAHRDWQGFMPATSARIQRLSTGERSLALHLPMLASIAAHYAGSNGESECPRLILLDELFAGVDVANREQLFGLLASWDLDAVLTSDHEWCAYRTLDGIAIHHLHADGSEPVTSSRFVWDGRGRSPAPVEA